MFWEEKGYCYLLSVKTEIITIQSKILIDIENNSIYLSAHQKKGNSEKQKIEKKTQPSKIKAHLKSYH